MADKDHTTVKALGLNTQPNDLGVPEGSLGVCENMEITRDNVAQLSPGFENFSTNLPAVLPEQIFSFAGTSYAHTDSGLWYYDTASSTWLRKRGATGVKFNQPYFGVVTGGYLYVSISIENVIIRINLATGIKEIFAGRYGVNGSANGAGDAARFYTPQGICTDGTNLYVCEGTNQTIRKIVISTATVSLFAGTALSLGSTDGAGIGVALFSNPTGICTDGTNLYVCDFGNRVVRRIVISTQVVSTFAGTAGAAGSLNGTGTAARFRNPMDICTDNTNLYLTDQNDHKLRKIVIASQAVTTLTGPDGTIGSSGSADGTSTAITMKNPAGLAYDGTNLYVSDYGNFTIRKVVVSSATSSTVAGVAGSTGSSDGISASARMAGVVGVVYDAANFYLLDIANQNIRKLYRSTNYVATLAGSTGVASASGTNGILDGIVVGPS